MWCHLVVKFSTNASHGVNFWVRCASGNVWELSFWSRCIWSWLFIVVSWPGHYEMSLSHFSRQMSQNRECGLNALHVTSNQNVSYGFNLTCHLFPILNYFVGQTNTLQCSDWWGSIPCAPSPEAPIGANLYWRKLQSQGGEGREGPYGRVGRGSDYLRRCI